MHLVSFSVADSNVPRPGALLEQSSTVIDLAAAFDDTLAVIAAGITNLDNPSAHASHKLDEIRLLAPLSNPPRIFAIGLNYRDHAAETKMALPSAPVVFFKLPTAIIGPGDAIVLPENSAEPDYEAELAFIIGKGG